MLTFAAVDSPLDTRYQIGGDFWDVFPLSGERTGIMIGDVIGHDAEAAAHAVLIKSVLRLLAAQWTTPGEALTEINRFLLPRLPAESMATLFLGIVAADGRRLDYASAGHEPPLLLSESGPNRSLDPTGALLGVYPGLSYDNCSLPLHPGDVLALYTDGLIEARCCSTGELLGPARLWQILLRHAMRSVPLPERARAVCEEVREFSGCRPQDDDRLLLLVEMSEARAGL